jgi:superfamily II DNA or RNA helicase
LGEVCFLMQIKDSEFGYSTPSCPKVGQIVGVRQRLYLVDQVTGAVRPGDSTLVQMSCIDDDAQGQPLEVLWEKELDAHIVSEEDWESISTRGFDPAQQFAAYLNTLRWNCVTSTDPKLLQSPFRAGIRLDAYQLEPLRKALLLPRVNLFIADDVGLGKTIEAGLIARELLLRKKVRDIVVACPPSMLLQWREELDSRFGLRFEILDKDYLQTVRQERGFGVNPWTTHSRFLISQRLLIDHAYSGPLTDWLSDFRPGSLFILDEAHHAAPSSGQRYAIDSQLTRAVRDLAHRFEHRLFLSATPHNGHSNSFSALLEILDPQRFLRGIPVKAKMLEEVMVRRLKEDLREISGGFARREVVQIDIDGLPQESPELKLVSLLDEYRRTREMRLESSARKVQVASGLLISGLQQRLFSSIEAFSRTLRVHRKTVQKQWEAGQAQAKTLSPKTPANLRMELLKSGVDPEDERALFPETELAAEEDAEIVVVTEATAGDTDTDLARNLFAKEQKLLDEMTELVESSRALPDARVQKLISWIREKMCLNLSTPGAQWNGTRVIIFTEWDDTKRYLLQQLTAAIAESDRAGERIAVFHGPTPNEERDVIKSAFNADPSKHPLRILIATDAAREGLNLQAHCWNLFHFDVPWNPSRMEQRNGRIDRKLQPNDVVYCHYFFYKQRPEDRVIAALVRKTKTIREELGSLAQVIDSQLDSMMKSGIRRGEVDALTTEIDSVDLEGEQRTVVDEELEATRARKQSLREQIDRLSTMLEKSQQTIAFSEDHFRSAISCALQILGAEPVKVSSTGNGIPRFLFPAMEQRQGADPTWAETMDSLRSPRPRGEKIWEWRRTSPIRPVVFEDPGVVTDEVVQLHLEQKVVQRLLSRFTTQGFVYHDLSRACMAQTSDAVPRIILIGRLALYGPGAARLHEELVPVTARWVDPMIRKSELSIYSREAEDKTLNLLNTALLERYERTIPEVVTKQLQESAPRDVRELLPHLEARAEEYARDAAGLLQKRAQAESDSMRKLLELQQKDIRTKIEQHDKSPQLSLDFPDEEKRQLEANRRYWDRRLLALESELVSEPKRIRGVYEVRTKRVEPVGLVYLWPISR